MDLDKIRATPLRPVRIGTTEAEAARQADGSVVLRLKEALGPYPERLTDCLVHWAREKPNAVFVSQRRADGSVEEVTFAEMLDSAVRIGTALLDRGLTPERPLMILSENEIDQARLYLGALHVGVPYASVSPNYSLLAQEFSKLRGLIDLMNPGLIYVSDADRYGRALAAVAGAIEVVSLTGTVQGREVTPFDTLLDHRDDARVETAHRGITPDTIGKFLFTSGTTGNPKGVIFPQRMLTSQRQQVAQTFAFLMDEPARIVDWLPWHHTFGGTNNFGLALYSGGTYRIDTGRPMAGQFEPSIANIRDVWPNIYLNTPAALELLLAEMREDSTFRDLFFENCRFIYYGGATLPLHIWYGLDEASIAATGMRTLITSGVGCTEAGPTPTSTNWDPEWQATVGVPVPGMELKIAPVNDKLELRFKGPCVTPGYWKQPELTAKAFDQDGYYRSGDAVRWIDPEKPEAGLRFDGRIAENYKLSSGTWVHVADVRAALMTALGPLASDIVIAGPDRAYLTAIVFPEIGACARLAGLPGASDRATVLAHPNVHAAIDKALAEAAAAERGASRKVVRWVVTPEPALLDTGELTDKRAISQKTVLARRAATVERMYAEPRPEEVHGID
ncbi:feruloyl-CoA synthase [Tropicimonas isoalkanivorans]|uniref:Trans-feruloyl-CoA synthase n=1 Tax=Tropicimonas isoalkanivorans TaxID=441112 RepID=A0A1I1HVN4_9RHOB|nr:feruloyl-CoA synthase [Tropicimonas isoalkanivorans]SFC28117.1 trans-feruloyl-CoA synthase [Tropicimonas isoalkanivorans]